MLSFKEFVDKNHYQKCRSEFESARHFLKTCGKPKDWYENFLISFNKDTAAIFKKYG